MTPSEAVSTSSAPEDSGTDGEDQATPGPRRVRPKFAERAVNTPIVERR